MAWICCENLLLKQTSTCSELVPDIAPFGIISVNLVKDKLFHFWIIFCYVSRCYYWLFDKLPPPPTQTLILLGDWTEEGKGDFLKSQSFGGKTQMRNKHWDPYIIYIKTLWNCHMGHHWAHSVFLVIYLCVFCYYLMKESQNDYPVSLPRKRICYGRSYSSPHGLGYLVVITAKQLSFILWVILDKGNWQGDFRKREK